MPTLLPTSWCDENRLLMQNLEREQQYLLNHGWELEWLPTDSQLPGT